MLEVRRDQMSYNNKLNEFQCILFFLFFRSKTWNAICRLKAGPRCNEKLWPQAWKCNGLLKTARWKTRGRGAGVRGPEVLKTRGPVENAGSGGKRGVWWKTRGLVENAGSNVENTGNHYFSPQYALSPLKWQGKILLTKLWWISIQHLRLKRVSR